MSDDDGIAGTGSRSDGMRKCPQSDEVMEILMRVAIDNRFAEGVVGRKKTSCADQIVIVLNLTGVLAELNFKTLRAKTILKWIESAAKTRKNTRVTSRVRSSSPTPPRAPALPGTLMSALSNLCSSARARTRTHRPATATAGFSLARRPEQIRHRDSNLLSAKRAPNLEEPRKQKQGFV